MPRSRLRLVGRVLGWTLLSLLGLVLAVVLGAVLVVRTDWGRHKVLTTLVPVLQRSLTGRLQVGALEGDLLRGLTLRDLQLDDAEGQPVARVRRVTARYHLLSLLRKTLHLSSVEAEGLWLHARHLQDGRLNLAALVKPKEKKSDPPDLTLRLGRVTLDAELLYDAPRALKEAPKAAAEAATKTAINAPAGQKTEAPKEVLKEAARQGAEEAEQRVKEEGAGEAEVKTLRVHGRLRAAAALPHLGLKSGDLDAALQSLDLELLAPARATLTAQGRYGQRGQDLRVSGVVLRLQAQGEELNQLVAGAELAGPYVVEAKGEGPLSALQVGLAVRPPKGELTVHGEIGATQRKLPWRLEVQGRGLDPHAIRADLPAGRVELDAAGSGEGPRGTVELKGLLVEMLAARLQASGRGDLSGQGEAQLELRARDLGRFSRLAGVALSGDVELKASGAREAGHLRLEADGKGAGLQVGEARVGRLALSASTRDLSGRVRLRAQALRAGQVRVDTLALDARGDRDALSLSVQGQGPEQTVVRALARGTVLYKDPARRQPLGVDAVLEQLVLGRAGQRWQTTGPARVRVDPALRLTGLALASGPQRLAVREARFDPASKALALSANAQALDLKSIVQLVPSKAQVPSTSINLDLQARGTAERPVADLSLDGRSSPVPLIQLPALEAKLRVHYGDQRVRGESDVHTRFARDTVKLAARFDVPVQGAGAISAEVQAGVPLEQLHDLLPPELSALRGPAELILQAGGTLRRPQVALQLRVREWQTATLRGQGTFLNLNYGKEQRLTLAAGLTVDTVDKKRLGALDLSLSAPLRLGLGVSAAEMRRSLPDTPVSGKVTLKQVNLGQLADALLASKPPVTAGVLDATLDLSGTAYDPTVHLVVDGRGVATPAIDQINLAARLDYERGAARLDLKTALRGAPLLTAQAGLSLPVARLLKEKGKWYQELPLQADLQVLPYDVRRLSKDASGRVSGAVQVRGTVGRPLVDAKLGGEGLAFQQWPIGSVTVQGDFDGARAQAKVRAKEPTGGELSADAVLPLQAAQPIRLDLVSRAYRLDYEPRERPKGALRVLRGLLDADLHVDGPRAQPRPYGSVHLRDGALGVAADPRVYRKLEVDVTMSKEGLINLRKLYASAEVGWAQVSGLLKLQGLKPERGNLLLRAQRFPISAGTLSLWLDANVSARGETRGKVFTGQVTVDQGTVHLPKLVSGGKKLQSTKPLEDVDYVDRRGVTEARKRAEEALKAQKKADEAPPPLDDLPTAAVVQLSVPGPLYLRGKEVNAEAEAQLKLELRGPLALVSGNLRVPKGWIDLLGRRWEISKAVVSLDGSAKPDPLLDVAITRKMADAQIYVEVHGTAERPKVVMRSDPPVYSESQIIAMVLTGDPNNQRTNNQSVDQKAIGMISGLLVGQIKDQLGEFLPLDVLKVDVGGDGYNVFGQTRVEVGKYLTDDLYVSYTHQFGQASGMRRQNSNQLQLEYQFLRSFALETLFGDAGVGSLDLYWTRRF